MIMVLGAGSFMEQLSSKMNPGWRGVNMTGLNGGTVRNYLNIKKELIQMKFEEVMPYMREGKKVIRKFLSHPTFISDYTNSSGETYKAFCFHGDKYINYYTNSFGETYKAFCFHGDKYINYYEITRNDLFAEDWEVTGRAD